MSKIKEFIDGLKGKKSYILAFALGIYAITGVIVGKLSIKEAIDLVFGSGAIVFIRSAISDVQKKIE